MTTEAQEAASVIPRPAVGSQGWENMVRKLLFVLALGPCLGLFAPASAQAPGPVVVADPPVAPSESLGGGALRHTSASTSVGIVGVYAGVSLLAGTLATIVWQRRSRAPEPAQVAIAERTRSAVGTDARRPSNSPGRAGVYG